MELGDINDIVDVADVTITILSQTAYVALVRKKPVVMLGYTQLREKGCTYEAFQEDEIEGAINDALQYGFTRKQQEAFLIHVAQIMKYYLYDDLLEREFRYGKPQPKAWEEIEGLARLLGREDLLVKGKNNDS